MLRTVIALAVALAAASVGVADARPFLSKQRAHAKAVKVMDDFGPLYDVNGTPTVKVVPARKCERTSRVRVYCSVSVKTSRNTCDVRLRLEMRDSLVTWHYPNFIFDSSCYVESASPVVIGD